MRNRSFVAIAVVSIVLLVSNGFGQTTEKPPAPPAATSTEPPASSGPGFDIATCQTCHADTLFTNFQHTFHAKKLARSCAECHGVVAAHAQSELEGHGRGPVISMKTMTAQQVNKKCLSCHDRRAQANFIGGVHERRGLSCTTCHSVHAFQSQRAQLKTARDSETCYNCHPQVRAQQMRQSHHPIREGKLDCGSCHDPHSNAQKGLLRAESINDLCYTCHTDKRGPFLWEHAPVRENCTNCHTPHGSNHERLLVAKMPWLCQRCHLSTRHPGTLYDARNTVGGANPSNRAIEHGCRNCHNNVHGTNAPSGPYLGR